MIARDGLPDEGPAVVTATPVFPAAAFAVDTNLPLHLGGRFG
jgi:hypothetical protein